MTSLFARLDTEVAIMRGELSVLRERIATAEERLAHLTITRETLRSLTGEDHASGDSIDPQPQVQSPAGGENPAEAPTSEGPPGGVSDPVGKPGSSGPLELAVARERMLVLLTGAGQAMKVEDIAAAIGEDVSAHQGARDPARAEGQMLEADLVGGGEPAAMHMPRRADLSEAAAWRKSSGPGSATGGMP
ncbi:hypothetical protein HET69_40505 [Streptomyces sp. CJ_13]|uniref:hypothetical protein n=1 Tax=Streptomyces sp. CJ_13 TaxID=2724943 RepID=UPI001BDC95B6|nr:hypothetical protein [Streptomyces sp. CJ_13]MBT1190094.1 hypothetical protein [Streptomyces sp. CJ_13]